MFENLAAFLRISLAYEAPGVVEPWTSQLRFLLPQRCFTSKIVTIGLLIFKKLKMKNCKRKTHDDGQRPIAKGHSGDLKND